MKATRFPLDSYPRRPQSHNQNSCRVDRDSQHDERQTPKPAWVAQDLHRAPSSKVTFIPAISARSISSLVRRGGGCTLREGPCDFPCRRRLPHPHTTHSRCLNSLSRVGDHAAVAGAPLWTSEVGCAGSASGSTRRHSAIIRSTTLDGGGPEELRIELPHSLLKRAY